MSTSAISTAALAVSVLPECGNFAPWMESLPNPAWTADGTRQRMEAVISKHGPWTAHNVHLGHGIYPLGRGPTADDQKLNRILTTVRDVWRRPLAEARILDLGCLEGLYAVALARAGAEVVGIEGRRSNLAKAQLAKEAWKLERLTLMEDDVRNLSLERHGKFDFVLCLGILYHLPAPDVFEFMARVAEVCSAFAVFDTHISPTEEESITIRGQTYSGCTFREHAVESSPAERLAEVWSSLDNETSFWLTKNSLLDALSAAGFSSSYLCGLPREIGKPADRLTVLAIRPWGTSFESLPQSAARIEGTTNG